MQEHTEAEKLVTSRAPLVPAHRSLPAVAHQRSPTLMAGQKPGSHEQVQVWAPSKLKLMVEAGTSGAVGVSLVIVGLFSVIVIVSSLPKLTLGVLICILFFALLGLAGICYLLSIPQMVRPIYFTTDNAGIGITTATGSSKAIYWQDIQSAGIEDHQITLYTNESIEMSLKGYPERLRQELLSLIVDQAGLVLHPLSHSFFIRPGDLSAVTIVSHSP